MYLILKAVHTILAVLTITGFVLRGSWMMRQSPLLEHRLTRTLPHVIDTLFLVSGIALVVEANLAVMQNPWLLAKFAGLMLYIGFGMVALRFGRTPAMRVRAFAAAIATFAYIVGVALAKSPQSWLAI